MLPQEENTVETGGVQVDRDVVIGEAASAIREWIVRMPERAAGMLAEHVDEHRLWDHVVDSVGGTSADWPYSDDFDWNEVDFDAAEVRAIADKAAALLDGTAPKS